MFAIIWNGLAYYLALEGDDPKPGARVVAAASPQQPAWPLQMQWLWLLLPQSQGLALLNPAYGLYVTASPSGSTAVSTIDARTATTDQAFVWDAPAGEMTGPGRVVRLAANTDRNLRSADGAKLGDPVMVGGWEKGRPNELWNSGVLTAPTELLASVLPFQVISHSGLAIALGDKRDGRWPLLVATPDQLDPRQHWLWVSIPANPPGNPADRTAVLYNPVFDAVIAAGRSPFEAYPASSFQWQDLFGGGFQALQDGVVRSAWDTDYNLTAGPHAVAGSPLQLLDQWDHGQPYELWTTTQVKRPAQGASVSAEAWRIEA